MLGTILLLIFTLFVVPLFSFLFGTPLTSFQSEILMSAIWVVVGVIAYTFIVGELSKNNSQVDKIWSIVPIGYTWYMTYLAGFNDRMVLMSILATIWGVRLTYNFARRGAYTWDFWAGEEDYRWEILRKKPGFNKPWVWSLFNFFFICFYQNSLIFLFTLPILTAATVGNKPLGFGDYFLAALFIALVIIEYIADQQQYDYQKEKYRRINNNEDLGEYQDGFVAKGLWSIVRHPNYAAEQSIWIVFYFFSVLATGSWLNWSISGALLLVVLFKGSSDFSEEISAGKYPKYKNYQDSVPRFIPFTKFSKKN